MTQQSLRFQLNNFAVLNRYLYEDVETPLMILYDLVPFWDIESVTRERFDDLPRVSQLQAQD